MYLNYRLIIIIQYCLDISFIFFFYKKKKNKKKKIKK